MKLRLARPAREAIGMRLRELRRFHTLEQTKLAQMAGLSQAIISQYEKGMTEVSLAFITFLTQRFGISTEWLISGYGPSSPDGKKEEPPGASAEASAASKGKRKSARYTEVPLVDPHVAASPGALRRDAILGWQPVPAGHLGRRRDLVAIDLKAAWVENMSPVLRAGGRAVIDREDRKLPLGGYYAVNTHAKAPASIRAIRRLNLSGSRLWLLEDRPSSQFEYFDLDARFDLRRAVAGRLVWICQTL